MASAVPIPSSNFNNHLQKVQLLLSNYNNQNVIMTAQQFYKNIMEAFIVLGIHQIFSFARWEEKDLSVVERELNDEYQPKSVRINQAGKKSLGKDLELQPKSTFMNPQQFKDSASTGTCIQLWWQLSLMKLAISSLQCRY